MGYVAQDLFDYHGPVLPCFNTYPVAPFDRWGRRYTIVLGRGLLKPVYRLKAVVRAVMLMLLLARYGRTYRKEREAFDLAIRLVELGFETAESMSNGPPLSMVGANCVRHVKGYVRDRIRYQRRLMSLHNSTAYEFIQYVPVGLHELHFLRERPTFWRSSRLSVTAM